MVLVYLVLVFSGVGYYSLFPFSFMVIRRATSRTLSTERERESEQLDCSLLSSDHPPACSRERERSGFAR